MMIDGIAVQNRLKALLAALVLCMGLQPVLSKDVLAQAMEYVVFSIEGPVENLTLGQVLKEGFRFEVPENASVSLIGKQGEVIKVDGPRAATVTTEGEDEEGEKALASISDLLFDNNKFVQTVGGTRSVGDETNLNEVLSGVRVEKAWFPSLSDASNYCLVMGTAFLHRQQADDDLILLGEGGETIHWQASNHEIDLGKYFISSDNKSMLQLSVNGRTIRLYLLEDDSGSIAEQAAWLAKQGCTHQALQLLASKIEQ